jgi:hypothetical protein
MSLLGTIERLQKAPLQKRKMILAVTVFIFMSIIIGIWILQLQYTLSTKSERTTSIAEPFKLVWQSASDSFKTGWKSLYEKRK